MEEMKHVRGQFAVARRRRAGRDMRAAEEEDDQ
jgi:hypothetical protein